MVSRITSTFVSVLVVIVVAAQQPVRAEKTVLSHASMKTMLENMGFEPTEKTFSNGENYYEIRIQRGAWNYSLDVNANSPKMVYVSMSFGLYTGKIEDFPKDKLVALLAENQNTMYSHFLYLKETNKFRLLSRLLNGSITPVILRRALNEMVNVADRTEHLWNPKKWTNSTQSEQGDDKKEGKKDP